MQSLNSLFQSIVGSKICQPIQVKILASDALLNSSYLQCDTCPKPQISLGDMAICFQTQCLQKECDNTRSCVVRVDGHFLVFSGYGDANDMWRFFQAQYTEMQRVIKVYFQRVELQRKSEKFWNSSDKCTIISASPKMLRNELLLRNLCQLKDPVLITGESGVGKELFARALYLLSPRFGSAFVVENCGELQNKNLLRSELFGHRKGSFTGALQDHIGVFERADSGVVFLDEIGELPLDAQSSLLRVIDQQKVKPVGAMKYKSVDFALIAATNRTLESMVEQGHFRNDLYYRLNVLRIHLPPLCERIEDIPVLSKYILEALHQKYGFEKVLNKNALKMLQHYKFPGNVRELQNIVTKGYIESSGEEIHTDHIARYLQTELNNELTSPQQILKQSSATMPLKREQNYETFARQLFSSLIKGDNNFWNAVYKPYIDRELNKTEVRAVIQWGLEEVGSGYGSKRRLAQLFNIPDDDYKQFVDYLRNHKLCDI